MIQNETKSPEILKAERQVEQAKARLWKIFEELFLMRAYNQNQSTDFGM